MKPTSGIRTGGFEISPPWTSRLARIFHDLWKRVRDLSETAFGSKPRNKRSERSKFPQAAEIFEDRVLLSGMPLGTLDSPSPQALESSVNLDVEQLLFLRQEWDNGVENGQLTVGLTKDILTFDSAGDLGQWESSAPVALLNGGLKATNSHQLLHREVNLTQSWLLEFSLEDTSGYRGGQRFQETVFIGSDGSGGDGYRIDFSRSGWRYPNSNVRLTQPDGTFVDKLSPFQFTDRIEVKIEQNGGPVQVTITDPANGNSFSENFEIDFSDLQNVIGIHHQTVDVRNPTPEGGLLDDVGLIGQRQFES